MPAAGHSGGGSGNGSGSLWGSTPGGSSAPSRPVESAPTAPTQMPGSFGVDVTSPTGLAQSMRDNVEQSRGLIDGLGSALFGPHEGIITGGITGALAEGTDPLSGLARGIGGIPGGLGDTASNALKVAGGVAERLPAGTLPFDPSGPLQTKQLDDMFAALPDSPEKQKVLDQIAADGSAAGHYKYEFVKQHTMDQQSVNPQLFPELTTPAGSLADQLSNMFAGLGMAARPLQRAAAGTAKVGTGLNRLQEIEAVHNGAVYTGTLGTGFLAGSKGNTDIEEMAYQRWHDGTWTADQALDFLSASGAGASHDQGLELAGSIALDPTVWGSLGAAGLSRLGLTGLRLAASETGQTLIRAPGTASRINVIGKIAENQKVNDVVRLLGQRVYTPMETNAYGKAAKVMRTIVDPLHAIGGNKVIGEATLDVAAETTPRIMAEAHGFDASFAALELAQRTSPEMFAKMTSNAGVYSGNIMRKVLMRDHVATMLLQGLGKDLIGKKPGDILDALVHNAPKDYVRLVKDEMIRVRKMLWDEPARVNLGDRMASLYGEKSSEEWVAAIQKMSPETLSYYHAATYGEATTQFLDAVSKAGRGEWPLTATAERLRSKLDRFILLNDTTLPDVGAKGILDDVTTAALTDEAKAAGFTSSHAVQAALIRDAQARYPELRYVTIDEANLGASIEQFTRRLENQIADETLPAQVTRQEVAHLPEELQQFDAKLHGTYAFGFRPEDDLTMGLVTDGEGRYVQGYEPWVDHVAPVTPGYRGSVALAHNVAGMPIVGQPVARGLDFLEANTRTLFSRVTSASITESARTRFVVRAAERHGLTEAQSRSVFQAVADAAQLRKLSSRGLSSTNMWEASRHLVPAELYQTGKFTQRDLLNLVVDAYEGDLRFVGLTQKFTGRAKALFARGTGSNFAGQFSEDLYQKIRFQYNPLFQTQERIEPWVLNGQRGVNFALGTKVSETDRKAALIYERMRNTGLIRSGDIDQAEFAPMALQGTDLQDALSRFSEASRWSQMRDVSGSKRLNLLRTLERNLGKSVRATFDKNMPGEWDRIVTHYSDTAGHLISDDEAAVRYIAEQGFAGDVKVASMIEPGASFADFANAISTAEFHAPANIGELKGLNLDFMAKGMGFPLKDGTVVSDAAGLRAALADSQSGLTMDDVKQALNLHGAHPSYVDRVENALDFHWDGFWRTVSKKFNLTRGERAQMELMMSNAARVRGMTPVDYMSQVFSPTILAGKGADVKAMESAVSALRAPLKGQGTPEMLMTQLVDVFHHHLDPSAQETLLTAFQKELPGDINAAMVGGKAKVSVELQKTLESLRGGWSPQTSGQFAQAVLDHIGATGKAVDPDVARAVQQFSKWSKDALTDGLLSASKGNPYSELLTRVSGIPTDNAVAHNEMQQLLVNQVGHAMRQGANDAFRLQYFSQERGFLERSLNHPFFGVYPASYMWGKIMPELAHFMAQAPFGLRTGAALYAFEDFRKAAAIQREFDPNFEAMMNKLGHSSVAWFLGYLLPSLPWDVGAAAPTWARDLAGQANENQKRVDRGEAPKPIDLISPINRLEDYVNPLRPVEQAKRPLGELGDFIHGDKSAATAPTTSAPTPINGPVQGTGLGPILSTEMSDLRTVLSGK